MRCPALPRIFRGPPVRRPCHTMRFSDHEPFRALPSRDCPVQFAMPQPVGSDWGVAEAEPMQGIAQEHSNQVCETDRGPGALSPGLGMSAMGGGTV